MWLHGHHHISRRCAVISLLCHTLLLNRRMSHGRSLHEFVNVTVLPLGESFGYFLDLVFVCPVPGEEGSVGSGDVARHSAL